MQNLLIVESPGKIKKIQTSLGDDWVVAASVGHVRDMPEKEIGVAAPNFVPVYNPTERGAQQIAKLKRLVQSSSAVYLAMDADREGESIAWHLKEALGLKAPHRITFTEITEPAIKKAINTPRAIDMQLVHAQEARRVLDRLVGYTVSRPLSNVTGQSMSAGRVQSPTIRILVERERAIRDFNGTTHFGAKITFAGDWFAEWNVKPMLPSGAAYWMDKDFADAVAKTKQVTVSSFDLAEARRAPPPPFTTSTFQQAAFNRFKLAPEDAMKVAQRLYEKGAITYMRTDSTNLADEAIAAIAVEAKKRGLTVVAPARKWKSKNGAQEAHEAIRPSHFEDEQFGEEGSDDRKVYRLIWERTLACQLEDARYAVRRAVLDATVAGKPVSFVASGRTLTHKGWLAILAGDDTEDAGAEADNPVPMLAVGQAVSVTNGEMLTKKTKPLPRFTQGSLVRELESEGIGRPSTYATIIKTIESRGYIEIKKTKIYATPKAEVAVDAMVLHRFSFIELGFTRGMEDRLDQIAEGKDTYLSTISAFYAKLTAELEVMGSAPITANGGIVHACPSCGKPMRSITLPTGTFWGCTGYPVCRTSLPDDKGKPGAAGSKSTFSGATAPVASGKKLSPPCPKCGGTVQLSDKWIVCDAACGFKLWREVASKRLSEKDVVTLLKTEAIPKSDGFKTKAGKPFSTGLKLNADKTKLEFSF
jgi:DNA topoisomerase-1